MADTLGLGRRAAATLAVGVGLGLVVSGLAALLDFAQGAVPHLTPVLVAHGAVAAGIGALTAALYGRSGPVGWLLALVAAGIATALASFLAPRLAGAPTLDTAQAALSELSQTASQVSLEMFDLPAALIGSPFLGLLWLALVSAVHAAAGAVRSP